MAQGPTILAEHQAGKRDFSQGTFQVVLETKYTDCVVVQLLKLSYPKSLPMTGMDYTSLVFAPCYI